MKAVAIFLFVLGALVAAAYFVGPLAAKFRLFGNIFGFEIAPNIWALAVTTLLWLGALMVLYRMKA